MKKLALKLEYQKVDDADHSAIIILKYKTGECEIQQDKNTIFATSWYKNAQDGWAMGDDIGCHRNDLLIEGIKKELKTIFDFEFIRIDPYNMDFQVNPEDLSDLTKDELNRINEIKVSGIEEMDIDFFPYEPESNDDNEKTEYMDDEERSDPVRDACNDILDGDGWKHGLESVKLSVKFEYKCVTEKEGDKYFEVNMFLIDKIGKYILDTELYAVSDYWLCKCREYGKMGWTNTDDNHIKGLMISFSRKLKNVFEYKKVELLNVDYFDEGIKLTEDLYELTELERNEITNSYLQGHREERSDPAGDAWNDILNGDGWKHGLD